MNRAIDRLKTLDVYILYVLKNNQKHYALDIFNEINLLKKESKRTKVRIGSFYFAIDRLKDAGLIFSECPTEPITTREKKEIVSARKKLYFLSPRGRETLGKKYFFKGDLYFAADLDNKLWEQIKVKEAEDEIVWTNLKAISTIVIGFVTAIVIVYVAYPAK